MRGFLPVLGCFLAMLFCLNGCARIQKNFGAPLPRQAYEELQPGVHYSRVLRSFGPPAKISAVPGGSVFLYERRQLIERQYGLNFPGDIGKYFKLIYAKSNAVVDIMVFSFDQQGMLLGRSAERFRSNTGGGMAMNFIFNVKSLADTSQYARSQQGIMNWGMALTQPLPVTLNAAQNLDAGSSGVEVLGMDSPVGQRTLEMGRNETRRSGR